MLSDGRSNHFTDGKPFVKKQNPTLWLTTQDNRENKITYKWKSPRKRVYTENLEANQKDADEKPRENYRKKM